jgi:hypothetical protein
VVVDWPRFSYLPDVLVWAAIIVGVAVLVISRRRGKGRTEWARG